MKTSAAAAPGGGGVDAEQLALLNGQDFCQALVDQLAQQFGADLVSIGERRVTDVERVRMLASRFDGLPLGDFEYESRATPCQDLLETGRALVVSSSVQERYPQDVMFAEEGIQSYVGVALRPAGGEITGLIQAAWRRRLSAEDCRQAVALMERYAPRLAAEVAVMQNLSTLAVLAGGQEAGTPRAAFRLLADQLQRAFKVRAAFIAERLDEGSYRILACCNGGRQLAPEAADIAAYEGTPCAHLRSGGEYRVPGGLQAPGAWSLPVAGRDLNAYLGLPLVDGDGGVIGHFALLHDREISRRGLGSGLIDLFAARIGLELRRRGAERQRLNAEQAHLIEHKTRSLGHLAGTIAHEFNNVLASMQGRTELALAFLGGGHPAEPHVEAVEDGLQSAAALVRQLLTYAKRGCSQEQTPCDLNAVVRTALLGRPPAVPGQGGQLELELEPGVLAGRMDQAQIAQLLNDLVCNGLEAVGAAAGTVTVATRRARPSLQERRRMLKGAETLTGGECLVLEVRDTGCGIAPETLTRVFDPFYSTKPGSRGLGLAAVPGVVSRHQAALAVDSGPGRGSVFRFYFPACDAAELPAGQARQTEELRGEFSRRRILVVDDEDTVRRAVAGLLQLRGCEVTQAEGYDAALALLGSRGPFDGAVIDMNMPGRSGWETLAQLRAAQPGLNAVMMSGFAIGAAEAGFPGLADVQVLDKPFTKEKLYRAVFR